MSHVPLFINVRKWAGLVFISGLSCNFTQVKVRELYAPQMDFTSYKISSLSLNNANVKMNFGMTVAINWLINKLAVPSIQYFQSNWKCSFKVTLYIYFFSLYIRLQERLIKIQLPPQQQVLSQVRACISIK